MVEFNNRRERRWGELGWGCGRGERGEGRDPILKLNMLTAAQMKPCGRLARSVFLETERETGARCDVGEVTSLVRHSIIL